MTVAACLLKGKYEIMPRSRIESPDQFVETRKLVDREASTRLRILDVLVWRTADAWH